MAQNGLLDFLQGASNSAASTVSAPVDGLAWLLRKAGAKVGDNPIGGSDWMRANGLTQEPQNKLMGLLGEAAGGVAPMVAGAYASQVARGLLGMMDNAAIPQKLNKQAGMALFDTTNLPNRGRDLIQSKAQSLADELTAKGFKVDLQHSGSAAGPSSYLKVFDPKTGRFFDDVRLSGHSKGVFNSAGVKNVATSEELQGVIDRAVGMRELGPAAGFIPKNVTSSIDELAAMVRPNSFDAFKQARDGNADFSKYRAK